MDNDTSLRGFHFTVLCDQTAHVYLTVMYFAASFGQQRNVSAAKTRRYIWCNDKRQKYEDIGIYQPEDDGYEVLTIDQGIFCVNYVLCPYVCTDHILQVSHHF